MYFLIFEQNQSKVYREVLIAGDFTDEDVKWTYSDLWPFHFGWQSYGRSTSDTAELVYDNNTVYFAQPSVSQLVPGGAGRGAFNRSAPTGLGYDPGNTPVPTGKNAPKRDTSMVLRYVLPAR